LKVRGKALLYKFLIITLPVVTTVAWPEGAEAQNRLRSMDDESGRDRYKGHPFDMGASELIDESTEFDESEGRFRKEHSVDGEPVGETETIPMDEFLDRSLRESKDAYFRERAEAQSDIMADRAFRDIDLGPEMLRQFLDGDVVEVHPNISAELTFAGDFQRIQNPEWSIRQQRQSYFKFDQDIQMNVRANIADRINFDLNYDTEASFDFDNQLNLDWTGDEDDIVQSIEAGNVSMPLRGSLIKGSQSLFGFKADLKFGNLTVQPLLSQQRSETENIQVEDGAQRHEFEISAVEYDANRHFFVSHYFRENYNNAMANLPSITSQARITRISVWVANRRAETENTRNVVAFMDLGETDPYNQSLQITGTMPDNHANDLYQRLASDPGFRNNNTISQKLNELRADDFVRGRDYHRIENAKQLRSDEFDFHPLLGYISLNRELRSDEVLAVAFEYTIGGQTFQVGDFSRDIPPGDNEPRVLFLKKLKGLSHNPSLPMWDLMMKNVYFLGSRNINRDEFRLDVIYHDRESGSKMDFLPVSEQEEPDIAGLQLIRVLGLDRLNRQREPVPDGVFDFIEGVTINSSTGRIYFPVLEPFGRDLERQFRDPSRADRFIFPEIYDSTKFIAQELTKKDNFALKGFYRGERGDEINIEAVNIPEGSVRVTAGGMRLEENVHYTVDYTLGRVRIIDQSILNSGEPINVSVEKSDLFNVQQKRLLGSRFDYTFSENFYLGGTFMYMNERPLTDRVNIGDEPTTNAIWGLDGAWETDSRWLTSMIDRLPFYDTKEPSKISLEGEFAQLIPGHSRVLGEGGTSYLDDFQTSEKTVNLRRERDWYFASTPQYQPDKFPNADLVNDLRYNFQRAHLAWYSIDPVFFRNTNRTPDHIRNDADMQSNHFMREVLQTEIFPDKQLPEGVPPNMQTLDLAYFPHERGLYNYNVDGLNEDGRFVNPREKWGGVMRAVEPTDFEAANVQYIEFWIMDPFVYDRNHSGGDFYINLGHISEDILRDGRKSFEGGLPCDGSARNTDTTAWGLVPVLPEEEKSFDNDPACRQNQDVGLDGLPTEREREFFRETYLEPLEGRFGNDSRAYRLAEEDPSNDRFRFYLGSEQDEREATIIERYKRFNMPEGNSPTSDQWEGDFPNAGRTRPDGEDISGDFSMNELEAYFQYRISLRPEDMEVGRNFITDQKTATVDLRNGRTEEINWYQFKVPVQEYESRRGEGIDFRSIRFMRMFFHGFEDSIVTRFGELKLVRGEWKRYRGDMSTPGEIVVEPEIDPTRFDISTVSLEENASRTPIPYRMPPGIRREVDPSSPHLTQKDERSLSLTVCDLEDGDARAAYKRTSFDIRHHEYLRMFAHLQDREEDNLERGDLWLIIRLGGDQDENYYEYEIPLNPTRHGSRDPRQIWPEENEINLRLQDLVEVKMERDQAGARLNVPYTGMDSEGHGRIYVVGNPTLDNVRTIMIGLRNHKAEDNHLGDETFDQSVRSYCAELWVNELRVTGFESEGGWAALMRARARLADLGEVTLSGNRETIGFGSIEESLHERSRTDKRGYNFSSQIDIGKFAPSDIGLRLPVYYSFSEQIERPKYHPLSPDIILSESLDLTEDDRERDSLRHITEEYESRRSLNFTNVRLSPSRERNTRFYDIDNYTATYAWSERFNRDVSTEYHRRINHRASLGYNYSFNPEVYRPLSGIGGGNLLKPIREVNFSLLPASWGAEAEVNRDFGEMMFRNTSGVETAMQPSFNKNFTMRRRYNLNHNPTRSIRVSYNATADARIQEPPGPLDTDEKRSEVRDNLLALGTMDRFLQNVDATYQLPFRHIDILEWIDASVGYQTSYSWDAAPPANQYLGNNIENSRTIRYDGQLDFVRFYNRSDFLRTINQNRSNVDRLEREQQREARRRGPDDDPPPEINETQIRWLERGLRVLMSVRNFNINYSTTEGTQLPGFIHEPEYIGQNFEHSAPGVPFVFGSQQDIRPTAIDDNWLSADPRQNNMYRKNFRENLEAQSSIEPFRDFRITVSFDRRFSRNLEENFRADDQGEFQSFSPVERGQFSMSFLAISTSFDPMDDDHFTDAFHQMMENRQTIAERLADENPQSVGIDDSTGYPMGYGPGSQDVLLHSFLTAYSGRDPAASGMDAFPTMPLPNWQLNYTGLSRMEWVRNFARSVTINHAYRSTYSVSNYQSTINWEPEAVPERGENLQPEYQIAQISLNERFAPLIGMNVSWINNWSSRIEYQRSRTLALNFENYQMIESRNQDFIVGVGYRTTDFTLPFRVGGRRVTLENELNFRFDFTLRDNITVSRRIDEDRAQANRGSMNITISPEVDYMINDNLTAKIFWNTNITEPAVSTQHPTSFTTVGFSLRYTLAL
jgi:cell surface protein SprA